ncbi:MAG: histidine phosphatase family protein, partial [Thermoleophilaceae bacterium]
RALYTSDMRRARETAAIVAERVGLEPVAEPRVRECAWGAWEGRLVEDIAREEPEHWQAWLDAGESFRFPSAPGKPGESLAEHMQRTAAALDDIARGPLPAVVVCHGGTIRVALASRDPRGLDAYHEFHPRNGQLVRWG